MSISIIDWLNFTWTHSSASVCVIEHFPVFGKVPWCRSVLECLCERGSACTYFLLHEFHSSPQNLVNFFWINTLFLMALISDFTRTTSSVSPIVVDAHLKARRWPHPLSWSKHKWFYELSFLWFEMELEWFCGSTLSSLVACLTFCYITEKSSIYLAVIDFDVGTLFKSHKSLFSSQAYNFCFCCLLY